MTILTKDATMKRIGKIIKAASFTPGRKVRVEKVKPNNGVGRNDPCWCGSGKKRKRCCMDRPQSLGKAKKSA